MKRFRIATIVVLQSAVGLCGVAEAAPSVIPIHADLHEDGVARNGAVQIAVALYDGPSNLSPMFEEEQTVDVVEGWLAFDVGAAKQLDLDTIPSHGELWLGLTIDGEPMSPRVRFGAVPYAYRARHAVVAEGLEGLDIDEIARSDHTHLFRELEGVPQALLDGDDVRSDADLMNFARRACYDAPDELHTVLDQRYFGADADPYPLLAQSGRLDGNAPDDLLTTLAGDRRYLRSAQPVPGDLVVNGEIRWASARDKNLFQPAIAFSKAAAPGTELGHDSTSVFFTNDSSVTAVFLAAPINIAVGAKINGIVCYLLDDDDQGAAGVRVVVTARDLLDPVGMEIADVELTTTSQDAMPDIQEFASVTSHVVAPDTVYTLAVDFETNTPSDRLRFYGCRINISTLGIR